MTTTGWWLIAFGIILIAYIGYNIFAMVHWGPQATISSTLLDGAKKRPIIAAAIGFVFGFLMAHLFWPQ